MTPTQGRVSDGTAVTAYDEEEIARGATMQNAVAFAEWQGQLALIARLVRAHGPTGLLVVGDFNATWGTRGFRTILDTGLTDAAAARGHPFAMTWLQTGFPLPEFVRIDHVLTGGRVAVTRIATGPGPGSDHRDLHATVAFER